MKSLDQRLGQIVLVIALLALNVTLSLLAAIRPVVPVAALTNAIASLGGDVRIAILRVQQLENALQQALQEIERVKKAGGK